MGKLGVIAACLSSAVLAFGLGWYIRGAESQGIIDFSDIEVREAFREGRTSGFYDARRLEALEDDPQALDALKRWAEHNHKESFKPEDFAMRKMFIPTENQGSGQTCISLSPNPPEPSGTPVYCYRDQTTDLIVEYTSVE